MAITMTSEFPATPEQYDRVNEKIGVQANPPDGLIIHTAAQVGDNMRVVDVWESEEAFNSFNDQTLMPAVMEVMGQPPEGTTPTPPEIRQLHNVIKP